MLSEAYCQRCQKRVPVEWVDYGIGPYEFWGTPGNHVDWQLVCSECESTWIEDIV
jgi:hypothetical protein